MLAILEFKLNACSGTHKRSRLAAGLTSVGPRAADEPSRILSPDGSSNRILFS